MARCYHRVVLLAHLSDIHLASAGSLRPWHLLGKRLTGAVHHYLKRAGHYRQEVVEAALRRVDELGCEHVVVTGDLSILALEAEFSLVADLLASSVGGRERLSVIPGNHDRYTIDSLWSGEFERHFSEPIETDLPELPRRGAWPFVRLLEGVALIGVDSAIPLPPFLCGGWVGRRQIEAVRIALEHPEVAGRCRVVLVHHPLFGTRSPAMELVRGLIDSRRVVEQLTAGRADLVLHGHNHSYANTVVPHAEGEGSMLVCEAGSSSLARFSREDLGGKFNVYRIEDGCLRGFDTYLYRDPEGFGCWKRWELIDGELREIDLSSGGS